MKGKFSILKLHETVFTALFNKFFTNKLNISVFDDNLFWRKVTEIQLLKGNQKKAPALCEIAPPKEKHFCYVARKKLDRPIEARAGH